MTSTMARLELWHLCVFLFPVLVLLHLYISPYTKVEESFNMQATHDILKYGVPTHNVELRFKAQYDHMEFPGAVPRTFIGAIMLAAAARPFLWTEDGLIQQMLVRGILGIFNAFSLIVYAMGVRKAYGKTVAAWFVFIQASQFHIFYYASRTLPNMFAFGLSTFALRFTLPEPGVNAVTRVKHTRFALYLLTIAAVIFRAELGLLLAAHCLYLLANAATNDTRRTLVLRTMLPAGVSGALVGLALTISIDTFFWQSSSPIWPELSAFLSNVFPAENSLGASAWGTSPWHWYLTSAIPRLLLSPLALPLLVYSAVNPVLRPSSTALLIPPLIYTTFYSILSHKETRFLFPILPSLTTATAVAAQRLSSNRRSRHHGLYLLRLLLIATTLTTALVSHSILLPLSSLSYPGAAALHSLHSLAHNTQPHISVQLTNLALQTGITRFLQFPPPSSPLVLLPGRMYPGGPYTPEYESGASAWTYDKTDIDNHTQRLDPTFWEEFDYCITESPSLATGKWDVRDVVFSLGWPRLLKPGDRAAADRRGSWAGLLAALYGEKVARGYDLLQMWVYETETGKAKTWWVEWGMQPRLWVLKKGYPYAAVRGGVPPGKNLG